MIRFLTFFVFFLNSAKINIHLDEVDESVKTRFKFGAALELCLDLFFAELCMKIFDTRNTILTEANRYLTHLKMTIRKETYTDEIHRDAFRKIKEISKFFKYE